MLILMKIITLLLTSSASYYRQPVAEVLAYLHVQVSPISCSVQDVLR